MVVRVQEYLSIKLVERRYQLRLYRLERGSGVGGGASARRGSGSSSSSYGSLLDDDHLSGSGRDMFADVDKEYCALREQRADLETRFDVGECERWTLHARRVVHEVPYSTQPRPVAHYAFTITVESRIY